MEASIWSVLTTNSFEEAVLKSINLGDDTDTIDAITGGLAGIIYGYNSIPQKWVNNLQKKSYLDKFINSFVIYLKQLKNKNIERTMENHNVIENERNDMIMNNKLDIKLLEDTIDDLKNNNEACTLYKGGTNANFIIPESNPGEQLRKFIQYFYESNLLDQNYVENYKKIKDKNIEEFTYQEVLTGLTKIIRGDRFISGEIYRCVKNGSVLKLIERLYTLVK